MKKTIPGLNGLRAISIFIVIFSHLNIRDFNGSLVHGTRFLDGQFGVTVFFVLSGFLITTLLLREEAKNGIISLGGFYLKRVIRIFPVYFALLLVYKILQLCGVLHFTSESWLTSMTYTKDFKWNSDWETAHLWSLSIEEQFYLFWPLVFMGWKRHRAKFAWAIVLLSPLFRIIGLKYNQPGFDMFSIFQRCDALMWGCIFALYHGRILHFIERMASRGKLLLLTSFLALLLLDQFSQLNHIYNWHLGFIIVPLGDLTGTFACIAIGAIIIISAQYNNNAWSSLLNTRLMNYLGTLSYSLYIWQQLFFSDELGRLSSVPLNLVLIFATANVSYYLVEKPFLEIKKRVITDKTPAVSLKYEEPVAEPVLYEEVL